MLLRPPRYDTVKTGDTLIKQDKWSGQSWRLVDNEWRQILSLSRDWERIDDALMEALHLPTDDGERTDALTLLRKKDPILADLADDELLERIKLVYSKEILVNMYLRNFLKLEEAGQRMKPAGKPK